MGYDSYMGEAAALMASVMSLHRLAEKGKQERAEKARADKSRFYKIYTFEDKQYVKKFLLDAYKQKDNWAERVQLYNELLVEYLTKKDYMLRAWQKPIYYTLSTKEYKRIYNSLKK